jgi:hypothetical protein
MLRRSVYSSPRYRDTFIHSSTCAIQFGSFHSLLYPGRLADKIPCSLPLLLFMAQNLACSTATQSSRGLHLELTFCLSLVNSFRCPGPSPSLSLEADKQVLIENVHGSAAWIFGLPSPACFVCAHFWGFDFLYCRCLIVVLCAGFDGTVRHLSMSSTPFRRSHSVSGNILNFYSILPLVRYADQRFSLKTFLPSFILWVFFPGRAVMSTTPAFWHNTSPCGHCPIL